MSFLIIPGVNSCTPIKEILKGFPYHICDIIVTEPEKGYELNKEIVKNSISLYKPKILFGKSYGSWIISESINSNIPTFLFSIPLKSNFPKLKNKKSNLIFGLDDPYLDIEKIKQNRPKFNDLLFLKGDHSLRPVTKNKILKIKRFILNSSKNKTFNSLLEDYLKKQNEAKVNIVSKTAFYKEIPFHKLKFKLDKSLKYFLNKKYGPVTALVKRKSPVKDLFIYQSNILDTSKINSFVKNSVASGGIGVSCDEKTAIEKSIFEALERYSLTLSFVDFVIKKYEEIPPFLRLNKKEFIFHDLNQKKKCNLKNALKEEIHWTVIRSLIDNKEKLYPVQLIIPNDLGYKIRETSSSGTALGVTKEQALIHGLKEAIERNSLMRWFYNFSDVKSKKIELNKKVVPKKFLKFYSSLIKKGFKFNAYVINFLGFNTIFLLAYTKSELYLGSSCGDFYRALEGSFSEILITSFFANTLRNITPKKPSEIKNLPQHLLYYQGDLKFELLDYLDSISNDKFKISKSKFNYSNAIKHLQEEGYEPYYKDVSAPEIRDRFFVERVIVPGFLDVIKDNSLAWKKYYKIKKIPKLPTPFA